MAGELESSTIWSGFVRPGRLQLRLPRPPGSPQRRANGALLTVSPARPAGWERLMAPSLASRPLTFPPPPTEVDMSQA